jgi:AcrR family transcriptional regulator
MSQSPLQNKHQARTQETQSKILDAAEAIFSEQGFEKTQLKEVAARAGYTRGAIYAHYSSKEDLFLALMEHRVLTKFTAVRKVIEAEPEVSKRPEIFKRWIATQVSDHSWGTLMLEFKLYALRQPRSRERLQHLYDLLFKSSGDDFIEMLFGDDLDTASTGHHGCHSERGHSREPLPAQAPSQSSPAGSPRRVVRGPDPRLSTTPVVQ